MSNPEPISNARATLSPAGARSLALQAGFREAALLALPYVAEERDAGRLTDWIAAGRHGSMHYLVRVADAGRLLRARVATPFPWARSVVMCLASYHSAEPRSTDPAPEDSAWIARYAWSSRRDANGEARPSDYHKVLLKRLKALDAALQAEFGPFPSRAFVDTGPLVERSLAAAAGLGWIGKNTCLLNQQHGSYTFLACLLTSLPVQNAEAPTAPAPPLLVQDRCGTCRRCLDACPTGALIGPYQMDARRCIAYLTIEHRGPIDPDRMEGMGRQIFGCDICQDVCPWNRRAPIAADPDLAPRAELVNPPLDALAALDEAAFERIFNGSPVRRAGFHGFLRNLAIAMGNSRLSRYRERLTGWSQSADEGLRAAAQWALDRLRA